MDFIQSTRISSTTATNSPLSATYGVSNIEDDNPGKPFISSAVTEKITVNTDAGAQGIFLFGLLADVGILEVRAGTSTASSIALNTTQYSSIDQLQIGTTILIPPEFLQVSSTLFWDGFIITHNGYTDYGNHNGAPGTLELRCRISPLVMIKQTSNKWL